MGDTEKPDIQIADAGATAQGMGPAEVGHTYSAESSVAFQPHQANLSALGFQTPQIHEQGEKGKPAARTADKTEGASHDSAQDINRFAQEHGVTVKQTNGRYEFLLKADGKIQTLGSADTLAAGDKLLHDKVITQENELRKTYRVDFSTAGDAPGKQFAAGRETNNPLHYRDPNLAELAAVRASLERLHPTRENLKDDVGPKFLFLKDRLDPVIPKAARYQRGQDGRPLVYFDPGWNSGRPPTERDLQKAGDQSGQRAIDHELGHHSLSVMHGPLNDAKNMRDNGQAVTKIYSDLGWKEVGGYYMIEGRDRSYYTPEGTDANRTFLRHDASGKPADARGQATSPQNAERISAQQMQIRAKVEPISEYFPGPDEMYAEGYSAFTSSASSRLDLKFSAPKLYDVVREADQNQINQKYPPRGDHTPSMVRLPDGTVAVNTAANAAKVAEFEKRPNKTGIVPFNTLPLQ